MKLLQILEAQGALNAINNIKLDATTAYRIGKAVKLASAKVKEFEDRRIAKIKEIGDLDPSTGHHTVPAEKMQEFTEIMEQMAGEDVSMDNLLTISMSDLAGALVEPGTMAALAGWFITDADE